MKNFIQKILKGNSTQQVYAQISNEPGKGINSKAVKKMQDQLLAGMHQNDMQKQFNAASQMLIQGDYEAAIKANQMLSEKYPEEKAECENSIGACWFFLNEFEKAISHYLISKEAGMDADMIEDNIWESAEAHYSKTANTNLLKKYLELYPDGSYRKDAEGLLKI
ncbi:MAG: hypothetical protein OEZ34_04215 [Spirochaetia bacterium]|nr:hypothetical protein [Spirochaetia bacterium]